MPSSCALRAAPVHAHCSYTHMLHYRRLMFMCHQCFAAILFKLNLQPCRAHVIPYCMRCPCIHIMVHSYRLHTTMHFHVCASAARFSVHLYACIEADIATHIPVLLICTSICIAIRIDVCQGQRYIHSRHMHGRLSACTCAFAFACTFTCAFLHSHVHPHVHSHAHAHLHLHAHAHSHGHSHLHAHSHVHICICICMCICIRMHICIRTCNHICMHIKQQQHTSLNICASGCCANQYFFLI